MNVLLLTIVLTAAPGAPAPPPSPLCEMPRTCAEAHSMLTERFRDDRAAAARWALRCGLSRLDLLKGRLLCGM